MKARIPQAARQKSLASLSSGSSRGHSQNRVQLIYSHLPPAFMLAREQHLRAQTRLEQRAQLRLFAGGRAVDEWRKAERELAQNLCGALQRRNGPLSMTNHE